MSSGGGTNTVTQTIPSWMQDYIQNNYGQAQQVAGKSFQPYTGQAVAPINPTEQGAISALNSNMSSGVGMGAASQGVANATQAGQYTPQTVGFQAPTSDQIQQYMSPYTQSVIDATDANMNQ